MSTIAPRHANQVRQITEAIHRSSRRHFAKEQVPNVSAADVARYHDLAAGMVSQLADDLYAKLRDVVVEGLRRGRSDAEIGLEIHAADLGLARSHANTWARTETTRFYTLGRTQAVEEAGDYVWGYEYVVIVDTRTTVICQGFIGKRVEKALMRLFPPFHFNCRTTVIAVMAQWITDEEEQPDGTELGPVSVAEGFGGDPRRQAGAVTATPMLLPDEARPPRQTQVGGVSRFRRLEQAVDQAHATWSAAGKPSDGDALQRLQQTWTQLAEARQAAIKQSARGMTGKDEQRTHARVEKWLRSVADSDVERGAIFDRRGRLLWQGSSGLPSALRFPGDDFPDADPAKHWAGAVTAHNHPARQAGEEAGFGDRDLAAAARRRDAGSHVSYRFNDVWYHQVVRPPVEGWPTDAGGPMVLVLQPQIVV